MQDLAVYLVALFTIVLHLGIARSSLYTQAKGAQNELVLVFTALLLPLALLWRDATGKACELQGVVSLSALYGRLAAQGFRVATPRGLMQLEQPARSIVDAWIDTAVDALETGKLCSVPSRALAAIPAPRLRS